MPSLTGTTDHLPYSLRMGLARGTAISNAAPCSSLPSRRQRLRSLEDRRRRTHLPRPDPSPAGGRWNLPGSKLFVFENSAAPDHIEKKYAQRGVAQAQRRERHITSGPLAPLRPIATLAAQPPPAPAPDPTAAAAAAAEIFRVPPPFRRRSACSGPLAPLRAALRRSQHGRRLPPLPILPRPPPPKYSESRRCSVDDRRPRDPWHPSAPIATLAAQPPPAPAPDPTPAAAAEIFRVPPSLRRRISTLTPLSPALRRAQYGCRLPLPPISRRRSVHCIAH